MKEAIRIMLKECLGLDSLESCLIITDDTGERKDIAHAVFEEAGNITEEVEMLIIGKMHHDGEEPDGFTAEQMLDHDVIILLTEKSLTHTAARKKASEAGARIASMPGITKDILARAIDVDYRKMGELTNKLADILDKGKLIKVTSKAGTDIRLPIEGRVAHGRKAGIFKDKGDYGNLPEAEAFIAPLEGRSEGIFVADASIAGIGLLEEPVRVKVSGGYAEEISGGDEAGTLKSMLGAIDQKGAFNIAELGIGTNPKARLCGVVLEDEKVLGTCHIALGNNTGFGGSVDVPLHIDCVIKEPTIEVDGKVIAKDGKIVV